MDKATFYTVMENQVTANGNYALLYNHYDDLNLALAKYYTICAAAALSDIPYHAAHIMASEGYMLEYRIFDRRTPEAGVE